MTLLTDQVAAVPLRTWILLFLAVTAWAPASYVWRYFTHERAPRDITKPRDDLSWKTRPRLYRALAVLAVLAGIGLFIFTPEAEAFARSDWLFPTLAGALGSYALGTVGSGWRKGEIEPLVGGVSTSFRHDTHPRRYWASLVWNGLFGLAFFTLSLDIARNNLTPHCEESDTQDKAAMIEAMTVCTTLLADRNLARQERADAAATTGRLLHRLGKYPEAIRAYSAALALDPGDSWTLHDRGILHLHADNPAAAVKDFDASLAQSPDNDEARFQRGWAHVRLGQVDLAARDFAKLGDKAPSRPQLLTQAAEAAIEREDFAAAITFTSEAIATDPGNRPALRLRAEAYWSTGQEALSQADDDRVRRLEGLLRE